MTPKQQRFAEEYLVDHNATQAAIRAGYSARTAEQAGHRLLRNVEVSRLLRSNRAARSKKLEISADRVVAEAWQILTADARELVEFWVGSCRHCWGVEFKRQRTAGEMERDRAKSKQQPFDEEGGIGFHAGRAPNPDCPECFGRGEGRVLANDTRTLSPSAVALYAGVKQTKEGFEVRMHDKLAAAEKLFRYLGLYDTVRLTGDTASALKGKPGTTLADQGRAVLAAAAGGEVSMPQAAQLLTGLASLAKLIETDELAARMTALEGKHHGT